MAPILRETPLAVWMGTIRNTLIFSTLSAPSSCSVFLNDGWLVRGGMGEGCQVLPCTFKQFSTTFGLTRSNRVPEYDPPASENLCFC